MLKKVPQVYVTLSLHVMPPKPLLEQEPERKKGRKGREEMYVTLHLIFIRGLKAKRHDWKTIKTIMYVALVS